MNLNKLINVPRTICAVDASTNNFAFAIFIDGELVSFDKLSFSGSNFYEKLGYAAEKSGDAIKSSKVDALVIEHTVFINSPKTMSELATVQGAILGSAHLAGIREFRSVGPIAWQTFIGNGRLTDQAKKDIIEQHPGKSKSWYKSKERDIRKEKTINFVNRYYQVNVSDHDIADAIGIGHYAISNWEKLIK
jgi:hypothetical protein